MTMTMTTIARPVSSLYTKSAGLSASAGTEETGAEQRKPEGTGGQDCEVRDVAQQKEHIQSTTLYP